MYMSGVRIGMVIIRAGHRVILREQILVVTALCMAAAGAATRGTCGCRVAATARPATAATATVSALLFKFTAW